MTSWSITQKLFWDSLINHLWLGGDAEPTQTPEQHIASLHAAMEWLAEFVLEDLDKCRPVLQEIEDFALRTLRNWQSHLFGSDKEAEATARALIASILEPLALHGLFDEFDLIFRRLIGYVFEIDVQLSHIFGFTGPTSVAFDVVLTQEEIEIEACELLKQFSTGQQPERLKYLFPFRIGILIERTLDSSFVGIPDGQPLSIRVLQEVPLLFLPLVAAPPLRKRLFEHFRVWFKQIEPPLAQAIDELFPLLSADDSSASHKGLRHFYCSYLLSTHFQLTRDVVRTVSHLTNLHFQELDALCGDLPVWSQGENYQEVLETFLHVSQEIQEITSNSKSYATLPILLGPSKHFFLITQSHERILQYSKDQYTAHLSHGAKIVEGGFDLFDSFRWLGTLLYLAYHSSDLKILMEGTETYLHEWLTEHLLRVLSSASQLSSSSPQTSTNIEGELPPIDSPNNETLRRSIHAKILRLAFRAAVSPVHVKVLQDSVNQKENRDIAGELLIRGVVLAHRILPVILDYTQSLHDRTHIALTQINHRLGEVLDSKSPPESNLYLQDQFMPELYGPEVGQYDHFLAGTLAVFREVGFDRSTGEGATGTLTSVPFWFTQPVKRALIALANRPENEAERRVREAREHGVPNRLQTYLDHTPQEYATELLRFASPDYTKEEELLLQGQTKLLELLRQISDDVKVDIESLARRSDRPDMIARLKVGEEEKRILIEVRTSAEPRYLRQAIFQLQSYVKHFPASYGLIVAPSISERGEKLCEEHGIGYMDLQGNASIKCDGIFIRTVAARKGKRQRGRTKTLFAPVSTRLVRAFLAEPERQWKLQELAAATQMSLGQAHKVKQALLNQEFIDTDPKRRLFLKDPTGLLNAWRETYRYEKNKALSLFSLDKIPAIEEKVRQYCDARRIRYAFTLFSGAEKLAPFVRYSIAAFYVMGDTEELVQALQLKPVESGANVLLFSPYDAGVFYGLQESQGFKIVSTIQLYLDLYSYGSRGREQAEFLREKLLGF